MQYEVEFTQIKVVVTHNIVLDSHKKVPLRKASSLHWAGMIHKNKHKWFGQNIKDITSKLLQDTKSDKYYQK